ncbi:MAG: beta-ketoacyl synthase chain length factor [Acinetobacter sp.]|jgi:hypothetical protein
MFKLHLTELQLSDVQQNYAALEAIPAMQRRRLSVLAKMAIHSALVTLNGERADYIVWVSKYGDEEKTLDILKDVLNQQTPSPTQFSISVHNAIAGLYSILCQDDTPSTSLSADWTDALIDAYAFLKSNPPAIRVLVVSYDQPLPNLYSDAVEFPAFALSALVSLEQPNLSVEALSTTDSATMESLAFHQFWQSSQVEHHSARWKKC